MTQFNLKEAFVKSLISLINSKEKFFELKLPLDKKIKIYIDSSACEWVLNYKYNLIKESNDLQKDLKVKVNNEVFSFFYYFFKFVMPDILMLKKFLPNDSFQILDIGAGIGLFELFLKQMYGPNTNISIVEVNNLTKIEHHKKEKKTKKLDKPLKVLNLAKKFLNKNNIFNITFIDSNNVSNQSNKPYDLVISIRSWGFLYDLDKYLDFVNANLGANGIVIADINKRTLCKGKFEKNFNSVKIIQEYEAHYRLIGVK